MKQIAVIILALSFHTGYAQNWQAIRDSINRASYIEHQSELKMLGIEKLRPGPSGDPNAPNAANSDESKAKSYNRLPDPLLFEDGGEVKTAEVWKKRSQELISLFNIEMYGKVPESVPEVRWVVVEEKDTMYGSEPAIERKLEGIVDNSAYPEIDVIINLVVTTPAGKENPVPLIMEFGWNFPGNWGRRESEGPSWKEQVLEKGWAFAVLVPTSIQADNGAGLRHGIIGLVNQGEGRAAYQWGALRAWAWGASRAMDFFESDVNVDASKVGIEGLSRYGKAALVTMAYDERFAVALVGSSGAGGAKILRRNFGEQVTNLASSYEFHWFAPNFMKYAGPLTVNELPVDAHQLIALCAPRPVFISTGDPKVEGNWVDARGMFLAAVRASPVYELLGSKGLETNKYPGTGIFLDTGELVFRQHEGGHTVGPNWPYFLDFAERYFK